MCEYFRNKVMETKLKSAEEAVNIKSGFIKSKLEKVIECKLKFYSYFGKPDIVASAEFSILFLFHKLVDMVQRTSESIYTKSDNCIDDDNVSLHKSLLRRTLSISESLIYCSRRKSEDSIIPPFHFGSTLQLHHIFGKKSLIDILNSHVFCCSNDDLRCFLSLAAEKELKKSKTVYAPSGLTSRTSGGHFIQEGDDNIMTCFRTCSLFY